MALRSILADEHLIPSARRVAFGAIPKRVVDAAADFTMVLRNSKCPGTARPFNSGYVGVMIDAGEAGKLMYLDQPGVVGQEDQSEGYVAFGKYPLSNPSKGLVYVKHRERGFGDVDLTKSEWEDAWREVQWAFEGLLDEAGYSPF